MVEMIVSALAFQLLAFFCHRGPRLGVGLGFAASKACDLWIGMLWGLGSGMVPLAPSIAMAPSIHALIMTPRRKLRYGDAEVDELRGNLRDLSM